MNEFLYLFVSRIYNLGFYISKIIPCLGLKSLANDLSVPSLRGSAYSEVSYVHPPCVRPGLVLLPGEVCEWSPNSFYIFNFQFGPDKSFIASRLFITFRNVSKIFCPSFVEMLARCLLTSPLNAGASSAEPRVSQGMSSPASEAVWVVELQLFPVDGLTQRLLTRGHRVKYSLCRSYFATRGFAFELTIVWSFCSYGPVSRAGSSKHWD